MAAADLSGDDMEALLDATLVIAQAVDRNDLFERILDVTGQLVPNDISSFNWMGPGRVDAVLRPELEAARFEALNAVFVDHWQENPLAQHFDRTGDTRALTWSDVDVDLDWRSGLLFQGFYRPLGVTDQLVVRLPSTPGTVAGLACNRCGGAFDARDRALLTALGRQIVAHLGRMAEHSALREAFAERGWQTHLVDGTRLVDPSVETIDTADTLSIRRTIAGPDATLVPEVAALVERQRAPSLDGSLVPGEPEEIDLSGDRIVLFLVPAVIPPYLLFVRRLPSEEPNDVDLGALVTVGLSHREAEVAARLSTGATNRQISEDLDISIGTVKKHLQRVFRVLDVETRSAAAIAAVRLLG